MRPVGSTSEGFILLSEPSSGDASFHLYDPTQPNNIVSLPRVLIDSTLDPTQLYQSPETLQSRLRFTITRTLSNKELTLHISSALKGGGGGASKPKVGPDPGHDQGHDFAQEEKRFTDRIRALEKDLEDAKRQLADKETKLKESEKAKEGLSQSKQQLERENEALQKGSMEKDEEAAKIKDKLDEMTKTHAELQERFDDMVKTIQDEPPTPASIKSLHQTSVSSVKHSDSIEDENECLLEWTNHHLGKLGMKAQNIDADFEDGFYLAKLIESIANFTLKEYHNREPDNQPLSDRDLIIHNQSAVRAWHSERCLEQNKEDIIKEQDVHFDDFINVVVWDLVGISIDCNMDEVRLPSERFMKAALLASENNLDFMISRYEEKGTSFLLHVCILIDQIYYKAIEYGGNATITDGKICSSASKVKKQATEPHLPGNTLAPRISNFWRAQDWTAVMKERILRIYVSSSSPNTILDCKYFMSLAKEKLAEIASKKRITIVFVDLRNNSSSATEDDTLNIEYCLEAIDHCPYFISFLEPTYENGTSRNLVEKWNPEIDIKYPHIKESPGLDLYQYEVLHASLQSDPVCRRSFFYSRKPETNSSQEKASDVHNQIRLEDNISKKYEIVTYDNIKDISETILGSLTDSINDDFINLHEYCPEDRFHNHFMRNHLIESSAFDSITSLLKENILAQLGNQDSATALVCCKTDIVEHVIMSVFSHEIRQACKEDALVFHHFVECSDASATMESIIYRLSETLRYNNVFPSDFKNENMPHNEQFVRLIETVSAEKKIKLVIIIDSVDKLATPKQNDGVGIFKIFPEKTPFGVAIVLSHAHHGSNSETEGFNRIEISDYDEFSILESVKCELQSTLSIASKSQLQAYLESANNKHFEKATSPEIESHITEAALSFWENKFGVDVIRISLSVLCVTRIGLSENEFDMYIEHRLRKLETRFSFATWKAFFFQLLESLRLENDRFVFLRPSLLNLCEKRYLIDEVSRKDELREYALWMALVYLQPNTEQEDIKETCHFLDMSQQYEPLAQYLLTAQVARKMLQENNYEQFKSYWAILKKNGFDCKDGYKEMTMLPDELGTKLVEYFKDENELEYLVPIIKTRLTYRETEAERIQDYEWLVKSLSSLKKYEEALESHQSLLNAQISTFGDEHLSVSESYNTLGIICGNLGRHEEALSYHQKQLTLHTKLFGEEDILVCNSHNSIGNCYKNQEKLDCALEEYEKSLKIQLKLVGEETADAAASYNNIGNVYNSQGKYEQALEYYQKALQIQQKVFGDENSDLATSYNNIGTVYGSQGKFELALEYYQKDIQIKLRLLGENHVDVAACYNNIGLICDTQGNYDEALGYYTKSADISSKILGEENANLIAIYNNIGSVYISQGKYEDALEYYKKSTDICKKLFGEDNTNMAASYNNMGLAYDCLEKYDEALDYYQKSVTILVKAVGEKHPDVATTFNNIGSIFNTQTYYEDALDYYEKSLQIRTEVLGPNHPDVAASHNNIGSVYKNVQRYQEALEHFQLSLRIKTQVFGDNHASTGHTLFNIGVILMTLGQTDEALISLRKAESAFQASYGETHRDTLEAKSHVAQIEAKTQRQTQSNQIESVGTEDVSTD